MKPLPRYVQLKRVKGIPYLYFRRGDTYQRLPSDPASSDFAAAYARLLAIEAVNAEPIEAGTVRALIADFKRSSRWQSLREETRRGYARAFDKLEPIGNFPFADIRKRHVRELRDRLAFRQRAADAWVTAIASLFRHAVDDDLIDVNPAHGIARLARSRSYKRWSAEQQAIFEQAIARGAVPRWAATAYHLAGWLTMRRANVLTFRWSGYDGRRIRYAAAKGGHEVDVRVPAPLKEYLDACPREGEFMVTTRSGRPWDKRNFTRAMRRELDGLGLSGLHLHGLRHSVLSELAESEASEDLMTSLTGQRSPDSARIYTRQARRSHMADMAVALIERRRNGSGKRETSKTGGKPSRRNRA